jgi:conjugative relaxase-like TrwC/TraI family protein
VVAVSRFGLWAGHDPWYPWTDKDNYYDVLTEPRGRAFGRGAEALGLAPGSEVTKEQYERVIVERKDPETGEASLGRAWHAGRKAYEKTKAVYDAKLAAEPQATQARKWQLRRDAAKEVKPSRYYTDGEISLAKTVTIYGESQLDAERIAQEAGDEGEEAYWSGRAAKMEKGVYAASQAALRFFEQEAGYCRQGYHGSRVDGVETGRFHEAGLVFFQFLQHTSRDDDPHWHIHNVIAMACQADNDGKWRVPDTYGFNAVAPAVSAVNDMYLAAWMTQELGAGWVRRADGLGWEIAGITPEMVTVYSSRRDTVAPMLNEWVAEYPGKHEGRKPTQRQIKEKREAITRQTRDAKEAPPDFEKLRPEWSEQFFRKTGVRLADVARMVSDANPGHADADAGRVTQLAPHLRRQVALMALSAVQGEKNGWNRYDLLNQLARKMDPQAANLGPEAAVRLLHDMADEILAGKYQPVTPLDPPEIIDVPAELRRADGKSVYRRHAGATYATAAQLTLEQQLLADTGMAREPLIERELAAQLLGSDAATLEAQAQQRPDAGSDARTRTGLRFDQAAAIHAALTDPKAFTLLTGPPGSGKSYSLAAAAGVARQAGVPEVYGITCSQAARNVLAEECERAGVRISAWNSTQFLERVALPPGHKNRIVVRPGSLFLLDEASMTGMGHFAQLARIVASSGGKGIPGGDQAQLPAVEGGGAYSMVAREQGYVQVGEPGRFANMWERDASLRLRAGTRRCSTSTTSTPGSSAARRRRCWSRPARPRSTTSPASRTCS